MYFVSGFPVGPFRLGAIEGGPCCLFEAIPGGVLGVLH